MVLEGGELAAFANVSGEAPSKEEQDSKLSVEEKGEHPPQEIWKPLGPGSGAWQQPRTRCP